MVQVTTSIDVDPMDILPEISSIDLTLELASRPEPGLGFTDDDVVAYLGAQGAPRELVDAVRDFFNQPIATPQSMKIWAELANVSA